MHRRRCAAASAEPPPPKAHRPASSAAQLRNRDDACQPRWKRGSAAAEVGECDVAECGDDVQRLHAGRTSSASLSASSPARVAYVPVGHDYPGAPEQLSRDVVLKALQPVLEAEQPLKVGYDREIQRSRAQARRHRAARRPVRHHARVVRVEQHRDQARRCGPISRRYLGIDPDCSTKASRARARSRSSSTRSRSTQRHQLRGRRSGPRSAITSPAVAATRSAAAAAKSCTKISSSRWCPCC